MQYDLSNELQRKAFLARAENLIGKSAVVNLSEKSIRTRGQNNYLHLLIGVVAMETGTSIGYCKEYYFKRLCNRDLFVTQRMDKYAGLVEEVRSTAELTKEEMTLAIDRFQQWGQENGIYLPLPDEDGLLREIAIEMGRVQQYLGG